MRLIATGVLALIVAACSTTAPQASVAPSSVPSTTAPQTAGASDVPEASDAPSATDSPSATATPVSGATSPPAPSAGGGGVVGPIFSGPLNAAFPPVIGGEQVQVFGPVTGDAAENLDESTLQLTQDLGLQLSDIEVAFASDGGASVIIFALRFPGVDSMTIDSTYISIQENAPGTSNFRVVPVAGRNVHAFDSLIGTQYSWVNGDILFTVYGSGEGAPQAIASMPLPTVALQAGGEVTADALIDLTISEGPNAGSYHAETSSGGCSRNALGANQFGLAYADDTNAQGFTSMQLVVSDAAAAESSGTDSFFTTVQIGPMSSGSSYNVDPADGDGTGTVTIVPNGNDAAVVEVTGETADGVAFEATITCNVVFDFGADG